jgi:hypothetical protein
MRPRLIFKNNTKCDVILDILSKEMSESRQPLSDEMSCSDKPALLARNVFSEQKETPFLLQPIRILLADKENCIQCRLKWARNMKRYELRKLQPKWKLTMEVFTLTHPSERQHTSVNVDMITHSCPSSA